jgi:multidrug/hemolysin transport system ATP-binding protein
MKKPAIIIKNLAKKYGQKTAVDDISFEVESGTVFAFLGSNGAGKSTTIGCITTTNSISGGSILVNGHQVGADDNEISKDIGVVFQASILDDLLTVRENIATRAAFYELGSRANDRIDELVEMMNMSAFIDQRYGTLSGGQKRHADIARALVHEPSILFLDEPTAGLDPASREKVWQTVYALQKKTGLTVFLTTHYMEETEKANQIYMIKKGKIIAHGTPQALRAKYSQNQLKLVPKNSATIKKQLEKQKIEYSAKDETVFINVESSNVAMLLLKKYESEITDFEYVHGKMDDVFMELTNENKEI